MTDKERVSQPKLCEKYNITNEDQHRALGDIKALEQIYTILCKEYSKKNKKEESFLYNNPKEIVKLLFI